MTKPRIDPRENGPYLVEGLENLRDATGALETGPTVALCRCGASANKPFCDGAHRAAGFSSARLDDRRPDRQDEYVGEQLTIHDNRGVCAHAGVCTERLPAVWRMGQEPWIDPDGASTAEIVDVVRACPSGALRVSRDSSAPAPGETSIVAVKNGPYVVSGGAQVQGAEFGAGASSDQFTLCRCGASKNKPFCDGAHWNAGAWDGSGE